MVDTNRLDDMFIALRSSEPYLADDGFTSGVMARLPETRQLPSWVTSLILLGFTAIGSAIAAWQLPMMSWKSLTISSLQSLSMISSLPILGAAAISTFLASYVVIWLAQRDLV